MLEGRTEICTIGKLRGQSSNSALPDCYLGERILFIEFATSTVPESRDELERQSWKFERDDVAREPSGLTGGMSTFISTRQRSVKGTHFIP